MADDMRLNPDRLPLYKLIAHVVQIVFSFIAWILEIVVFRSDKASVTGSSGWAFAVCFLSAPAWIYLIGAPRYPRTRRIAHPYAMVAVDILCLILWLSAFAAQASYNASGKCGHGCGTSKGVVALGVFNTLLFGVTTFFSLYTVKYYQFHGELPGYGNLPTNRKGGPGGSGENIDPDMAAFSTNLHDDEPYARIHDDDDAEASAFGHEASSYDYHGSTAATGGGYGGGGGSTVGYGGGSTTSYGGGSTTSYGGGDAVHDPVHIPLDNPFDDGHGLRPAASAASLGSAAGHSAYAPSAAHTAYDANQPVRFPDADYDRH